MRRRYGFTLVELLVVIGIIAILIAILVPTLAGARRSANTLKCAANLRSLGATVMLYVNENRGHIPAARATYRDKVIVPWCDQLAKYVFARPATGTPPTVMNDPGFERSVFVGCPVFSLEKLAPPLTLYMGFGYGMNMLPVAPLMPAAPNRWNYFVDPAIVPRPILFYGRFFKLKELKNGANRALIADATGYAGIRAMSLDPLSYYRAPGNYYYGDIDYFRHGKYEDLKRPGVNVLFCDGHAELCTPWQAYYAVRDPGRR